MNKTLAWLTKNKRYLSLNVIEKEIGVPQSTLSYSISKRKFHAKWEVVCVEGIDKIRKKME